MVGVHVRLDLEHEARDLGITRMHLHRRPRPLRLAVLRRRGVGGQRGQQLLHSEMAQRRAEQNRRHVPLEERPHVERLRRALHQLRPLDRLLQLPGVQHPRDGVGLQRYRRAVLGVLGVAHIGQEAIAPQLDHPLEPVPRSRRPKERRGVEGQLGADLVQQGEGVQRFPVHLVDEGDDGDVAQAADLEQLQRLRLDALGGVEHHHRAVGGGQGAVGVLAEVLVAGRVQQVEEQVLMLEGHHRGGDRNAPLPLDLHPVRARAPLLAPRPHRPGLTDRAAGQQDVLGQGGLTGVGMRDDGEGAPPGGLRGGREFRHGG